LEVGWLIWFGLVWLGWVVWVVWFGLVGWFELVGWLVGWLVWLFGLVGLVGWMVGWLDGWMIDGLVIHGTKSDSK
jgi:hypothetical protein